MIFIDTNIILDIWDGDPIWAILSRRRVERLLQIEELAINPIVYAELAPRFNTRAKLDRALDEFSFLLLSIPREASFLAGRAHLQYRRRGGSKSNVLPDFFIGAHAVAMGAAVLTRDARRYVSYFPTVRLITP